MTVKINIQGINRTMAVLQSKKMDMDKEIKQSMEIVGRHMQNEVKLSIGGHKAEHVSVDTGHLMGNVFFQTMKGGVMIFTHVPYANIVEYSTRIAGGPRRHFNNSLDRNKLKIREIIRNQINI